MPRTLALLLALLLPAAACTPALDDDDSSDDDDTTTDDDDTVDDDDDATMDDDDTGDDDDDDDTEPCGLNELRLDLQVIGDFGPGTSFDSFESITLLGTLENNCPFEQRFETNSGCLLEPWTLSNDSTGVGEGRGCDDAITSWSVEQGGVLEDEVQMGQLSPGQWTWSATFMNQEASVQFQVNEVVIGVQ